MGEVMGQTQTLGVEVITSRERGLGTTKPPLLTLDGSHAVRRPVVDVHEYSVIQRCPQHKTANVKDTLPEKVCGTVAPSMRTAYRADSAPVAEAQLLASARVLDKSHLGGAGSLRVGLTETLSVLRLRLPPTLQRSACTGNRVESMLSICRSHAGYVKRRHVGQMSRLWCAVGMLEATKQFRRVSSSLRPSVLKAAPKHAVAADSVSEGCYGENFAQSALPPAVRRDSGYVACCCDRDSRPRVNKLAPFPIVRNAALATWRIDCSVDADLYS